MSEFERGEEVEVSRDGIHWEKEPRRFVITDEGRHYCRHKTPREFSLTYWPYIQKLMRPVIDAS